MSMAQGVTSVIIEFERYNLIEHPMGNNYAFETRNLRQTKRCRLVLQTLERPLKNSRCQNPKSVSGGPTTFKVAER
jgi:hypothetical protein